MGFCKTGKSRDTKCFENASVRRRFISRTHTLLKSSDSKHTRSWQKECAHNFLVGFAKKEMKYFSSSFSSDKLQSNKYRYHPEVKNSVKLRHIAFDNVGLHASFQCIPVSQSGKTSKEIRSGTKKSVHTSTTKCGSV